MKIEAKKFVHKELVFVVREENKLVGIKVKGYQGDINILAEVFQLNVKNLDMIKQEVANKGSELESIESYEEIVNQG